MTVDRNCFQEGDLALLQDRKGRRHLLTLLKPGFEEFDINAIPMDDPPSYALLCEGDTDGVFQLESSGMTDLVLKLKPANFREIIPIARRRAADAGDGHGTLPSVWGSTCQCSSTHEILRTS